MTVFSVGRRKQREWGVRAWSVERERSGKGKIFCNAGFQFKIYMLSCTRFRIFIKKDRFLFIFYEQYIQKVYKYK